MELERLDFYPLACIKDLISYQNSHRNVYGVLISRYYVNAGTDSYIIYQCTQCNKYLGSYSGQEYHKCYKEPVRSVTEEAKKAFLDFVCCCNISERAVESIYFERFIITTKAQFIIPYNKTFHEMLKNYALNIQNENLLSLKGQVASILIDGAKKCFQEFEGVIIYTHNSLKFLACAAIADQKSATLANLIAKVITLLNRNNTRVVAVCSDNASSNVKALNGDKDSAQALSDSFFIRQGCGAHSVNLAIMDVFATPLFKELLNALNTISKYDHGPVQTIRWCSVYDVTKHVCDNYNQICYKLSNEIKATRLTRKLKSLEEVHAALCAIPRILGSMPLSEVVLVLRYMQRLIQCLESDKSSIVDVFTRVYSTLVDLKRLHQYLFTSLMIKKLENRAINTIQMKLPLLAFLLTKEGLIAYRTASTSINRFSAQRDISKNAKDAINEYMKKKSKVY